MVEENAVVVVLAKEAFRKVFELSYSSFKLIYCERGVSAKLDAVEFFLIYVKLEFWEGDQNELVA